MTANKATPEELVEFLRKVDSRQQSLTSALPPYSKFGEAADLIESQRNAVIEEIQMDDASVASSKVGAPTPGPWFPKMGRNNSWTVRDTNTDHPIAELWQTDIPVEERAANARLIAAAPELAQCLRIMLDEDAFSDQAIAEARVILTRLDK